MPIVGIDPGTTNTGLVYMDEGYRILCVKTVSVKGAIKHDQDALRARGEAIAARVADWLADKPRDAVVIEGFVTFPSRQNAYTYQTPYLCGYLQRALREENLIIQTSAAVLNPRARGSMAQLFRDLTDGRETFVKEQRLLTNEHLRSAACHAAYYLVNKAKREQLCIQMKS